MKSPKCPHAAGVVASLLLAACAAGEPAPSSTPDAIANGLACTELEQGGAARPFTDGAPGVGISELRAEDLPGYRGQDDDLDPNAPVGVRYSVAAAPGLSEAWLERQVHCYRAARPGTSAPDPLLVPDARVSVSKASGRYLVDVTSRDEGTAREVLAAAAAPRR